MEAAASRQGLAELRAEAARARAGLLDRLRGSEPTPAKTRPKGTAKRRKAEKARRRARARNR